MTADPPPAAGPAWRRRGWWLWPALAALAGAFAVVGLVVGPGLARSAVLPGSLDMGPGAVTPAIPGAHPTATSAPAGRPTSPPAVIVVTPSRPVVGEDVRGAETGDGATGERGGG